MSNAHVSRNVGNCRILLWSVSGVMVAKDDRTSSLKCKTTKKGDMMAAHPVDPLHGRELLTKKLNALDQQGPSYFQSSICVSRMVNNIPPYPDPHSFPTDSKFRNNLESHINSLGDYTPLGIYPVNPASNEGNCRLLAKFIRDFQNELDETIEDQPTTNLPYRIYLTDVNIYPRIMQVHYLSMLTFLSQISSSHFCNQF